VPHDPRDPGVQEVPEVQEVSQVQEFSQAHNLPEVQAQGAPGATRDLVPVDAPESGRMPLMEHLKELRVRLIRALVALAIGFAIAYAFADQLFALLTWPIRVVSPDVALIGTGVGEAFFTKIKVAMVAGLFIASPAVLYEIWKFVAPGLYTAERRMAAPFVVSATIFFLLGGYFCWEVVLKVGYAFFLSEYKSIGVKPEIRISEYLTFSSKLLLAFALTFEMPIFAYFLTRLGLIDYRQMLKYFRYAVLAIFVVAAALTPPDMVSQFLLAIPLLGLYGLSIGVSYVFRAQPDAAAVVAAPGETH
jgi:sec-independent protein translocase protein TatC